MTEAPTPEISLVIPFYNEEACVTEVCLEAEAALRAIGLDYELIAVDDGSRDATWSRLTSFAAGDPRVRLLSWHPNRGQAAALYRGLRAARAPIIATMDGDAQNDPADLALLLRRLQGGDSGDRVDMVVGYRVGRRDSSLRRVMSRLANAVRRWALRDGVRDSGCAIKVFRSEVVDALIPLRTLYSFIPALALAAGFRIAEAPVHHRERRGGRSNYGLRVMLWRPFIDLLGVAWFSRRRFPCSSELDEIGTRAVGRSLGVAKVRGRKREGRRCVGGGLQA